MIPSRMAAALLAMAVACTGAVPDEDGDAGPAAAFERPGWFEEVACRLPREHLVRIQRGYDPERSGEIQVVPREPNFIGAWLSHSGPWPYVQRVPLFVYGPGHVPPQGRIDRPVTVADLAPTLARHIGFDFRVEDGEPLGEAVEPAGDAPRLVVVVVWDGAGRNVLAEYPGAWPTLQRLIPQGAWFDDATVGTSPSVTPAVHTTIGTGSFPSRHGIVDLRFRVGDDLLGARRHGPTNVRTASLADLYDREMGNEPKVALVADEGTLGMIGQGSALPGGDRDVAIAQQQGTWGLEGTNAELFQFRPYVLDVPGLDEAIAETDRSDGTLDGAWMGEEVFDESSVWGTPAFSEYQTAVIEEVIRREGLGDDDVPDLLFTNYKQIDKAGHVWSMNSPQMRAVVRSSDRALEALIRVLDERVGEGRWVMAFTADHGATPSPLVTGAFVISPRQLEEDLDARFDGDGDDRPAIRDPRVTQMWVDVEELSENGSSLKDVAAFLLRYTKGQNARDPSTLAPDEVDEPVFEAAFPGAVLENLACPDGRGSG